jgi:acetyltransferase
MWRYSLNLQALYETPIFTGALADNASKVAKQLVAGAQPNQRTILTEYESKQLLAAYNIPVTTTKLAHSADEAVAVAEAIGYPVVLKLHSEKVTHKSDKGGVKLRLENAAAVRTAYLEIEHSFSPEGAFQGVTLQPMMANFGYELIVGSSTDPQFGPVLVFGLGGQWVEIMQDRAHALPPLTTTLARRMMENTRIYQALKGIRGKKPVDMEKLEELLVRFSQLVLDNPRIADIEINPLLAGPDVLMALDARIILHPASIQDSDLPRPAIRPYPVQYISTWQASDGTQFTLRPIRPDDEPLMVEFHHELSERSVYLRYFAPLQLDSRISHERLTTKCFIDYDREIALVAEHSDANGILHIAGVARLIRNRSGNDAEVAFIVADKYQHRGLGSYLLQCMINVARHEGIASIEGSLLAENMDMKDLFARAGFRFGVPQERVVTATRDIDKIM